MICARISDLNDPYSDMFEDSDTEEDYPIDLSAFDKVIVFIACYGCLSLLLLASSQ